MPNFPSDQNKRTLSIIGLADLWGSFIHISPHIFCNGVILQWNHFVASSGVEVGSASNSFNCSLILKLVN